MQRGRVRKWNSQKGYGFIKPDDGGDDVFVHTTDLPSDIESLSVGDLVEFKPEDAPKGRRAGSVRLLEEGTTRTGGAG